MRYRQLMKLEMLKKGLFALESVTQEGTVDEFTALRELRDKKDSALYGQIADQYMEKYPDPPEYDERLKAAYRMLSKWPKDTLQSILKEFDDWNWPAIFGNPPVGDWEELPNYREPWMPKDTVVKTDFIRPIADALLVLDVTYDDLYEWDLQQAKFFEE